MTTKMDGSEKLIKVSYQAFRVQDVGRKVPGNTLITLGSPGGFRVDQEP